MSDDGLYRTPIGGTYHVSAVRFEPTGERELRENPDRTWWAFWRPKMTLQPVYRRIEASTVVEAKPGDALNSKSIPGF